jgi:hypothetical protein
MFGSPLLPVVCTMAHVLFTLSVFLVAHSGVQHILCCVFVLLFFVLCTICCQFLWIVPFALPLQFSTTFIKTLDRCLITFVPVRTDHSEHWFQYICNKEGLNSDGQ